MSAVAVALLCLPQNAPAIMKNAAVVRKSSVLCVFGSITRGIFFPYSSLSISQFMPVSPQQEKMLELASEMVAWSVLVRCGEGIDSGRVRICHWLVNLVLLF